MVTRLVFVVIALGIVGGFAWAYRHDAELTKHALQIGMGDPSETVREMLGEPSSEGPCGSLTPVPTGCAKEYVYKYYYTVFQPQYEVVWLNAEEKVIGVQHVQKLF